MFMSLSSTSIKKKNLLEAVVFYKCHCEHYVKGLVYHTYIFAHAFIQTPLTNNDQLVMF